MNLCGCNLSILTSAQSPVFANVSSRIHLDGDVKLSQVYHFFSTSPSQTNTQTHSCTSENSWFSRESGPYITPWAHSHISTITHFTSINIRSLDGTKSCFHQKTQQQCECVHVGWRLESYKEWLVSKVVNWSDYSCIAWTTFWQMMHRKHSFVQISQLKKCSCS